MKSAATYSPTAQCRSTIGAEGLDCWVRDGTRYNPLAKTTDFDFDKCLMASLRASRSLRRTLEYASVALLTRLALRSFLFVKEQREQVTNCHLHHFSSAQSGKPHGRAWTYRH